MILVTGGALLVAAPVSASLIDKQQRSSSTGAAHDSVMWLCCHVTIVILGITQLNSEDPKLWKIMCPEHCIEETQNRHKTGLSCILGSHFFLKHGVC